MANLSTDELNQLKGADIDANLQAAKKRADELYLQHFTVVPRQTLQTIASLQPAGMPPPQAIWERFSWEVIRWLGGTTSDDFPALQIVPFALLSSELNWDNPIVFMRNTADNVPDWNVYNSGTGVYFSDQYEAFLNAITKPPIDEDARAKAEQAIKDLLEFQTRRQKVIDNINLRWLDYDRQQKHDLPPYLWKTQDEFFKDYRKTISEYISLEVSFWASIAYWKQKSMGGPDGAFAYQCLFKLAQDRISVPQFLPDGTPAGEMLIRPYYPSPVLKNWIQDGTNGKLTRTNLHIKHDTGTRDTTHTTFGGGAGFFTPFVSIGVRGNYDKVEINYEHQSFELNMTAAIQKFDINPGEWFNSTAISYFKDGPFESGVVQRKHDAGKLFGKDGFFSLRPIQGILVFNPEVALTILDQSYHYMRQRVHGEARVCIGPFAFGGAGYDDDKEYSHWDDRSQTVTFFENRNKAFLLAVNNFVFKA